MKVLRLKDACAKAGIGRSRLYKLEAEERFPARVELGPNSVGWFEHEIDEWLAARPRRSVRNDRGQPGSPEREGFPHLV